MKRRLLLAGGVAALLPARILAQSLSPGAHCRGLTPAYLGGPVFENDAPVRATLFELASGAPRFS